MQQVLELVQGTDYGRSISTEAAQKVLDLVDSLAEDADAAAQEAGGAAAAESCQQLDGSWELVFTTEVSVRKIVGGLVLGLPVERISQEIDLRELRVTNRIEFARASAAIEASGPAAVAGRNRVQYSFDRLFVEALGLRVPLPLPGRPGGWTEAVGAGRRQRIMRNSLGDTLVFTRSQ